MYLTLIHKVKPGILFPVLDSKRHKFTEAQKQTLMERYQANASLSRGEARQYAISFNTTVRAVHNWFSDMRQRKGGKKMFNQSKYGSVRYYQV